MSTLRFPLLLAILVATWTLAVAAVADPAFPALTGRVVDQPHLLTADKRAAIEARLAALEAETGDQLVVVAVSSLQGYAIEDYGYRLGRAWGIGQQGRDNGVLLIIAPEERKVRIEVGYGLEPVLTDALAASIIHNDILPAFRVGGFERGIEQGVDAIITQLSLDREEAMARAAAAATAKPDVRVDWAVLLFIGGLVLLGAVGVLGAMGGRGRRWRGQGGKRADGVSPILIWAVSEALKNSHHGGGSGGRSGGGSFGGFGGGGFSGGGGSFGGGGASGGW